MNILITGAAGFIGFHVSKALLKTGARIVGIDNLNDYYSVQLKTDRLQQLLPHPQFHFYPYDLTDAKAIAQLFSNQQFTHVVHLAAQAGVRYSLENPSAYINSNVVGTLHILEGCRHYPVQHLVYASSSSVYGLNRKVPFATSDNVDHPISLYAATKKSNELMAHTYSHLYAIPTTGLRFFTVYGPWGRPDMATFKFTDSLFQSQPINIYHNGQMQRDFTYIDDIVIGIEKILNRPATPINPQISSAPYRLYNIGNHQPVSLLDFIALLEKITGLTAKKNMLPIQPGDVVQTFADIEDLQRDFDFAPSTSLETGLQKFVDWYKDYYIHTKKVVYGIS